ncbi:MAG: hypothetical protein HYZ53_01195 [Planctomycetes bacterium]|nr:hypothetical protein [Planctomycetota bacterium]
MLRGQVRRVVMLEAALMGAAACLLGVVAGLVLGYESVTTVNLQATGWSTGYHVPAGRVAVEVSVVFAAVLFAAFYPSGRAARLNIVEALECE